MQNTRDPIAAIAAVLRLALLLVEVSTPYPYDFEFSAAVKKKLKTLNCALSLLAASYFRAGRGGSMSISRTLMASTSLVTPKFTILTEVAVQLPSWVD